MHFIVVTDLYFVLADLFFVVKDRLFVGNYPHAKLWFKIIQKPWLELLKDLFFVVKDLFLVESGSKFCFFTSPSLTYPQNL
jgi:hypothetical protein